MLGLVRHARACPRFSKISKQQYLWERLSYFVYLLHAVTHPWKVQCYHVDLVGYRPTCPKFPETTNQYFWKGSCDFVGFLQAVICILLDIHWSYKNVLFWAGIVRHSLSANQTVRCFKLKKLKKDMRHQVDFLLPFKLEYCAILVDDLKILLANQFAGFLTFGLFDWLNLIPGAYCYIVLVFDVTFKVFSCYIFIFGAEKSSKLVTRFLRFDT